MPPVLNCTANFRAVNRKMRMEQSESLRDAVTVRQWGPCYPTFNQGKAGKAGVKQGRRHEGTSGTFRYGYEADAETALRGNGSAFKTSRLFGLEWWVNDETTAKH